MRKGMMTALAMLAAGIVYGFTPQAHTNRVVRDGVTYVQRGALGAGDYVVTNVTGGGDIDTNAVKRISAETVTNSVTSGYIAQPSVTNGLCTTVAAQGMANAAEENAKAASLPIEGGEIEGNITYGTLTTFGQILDGVEGLKVGDCYFGSDGFYFPSVIWIPQDTSGDNKPYLMGDWYLGSEISEENKIARVGDFIPNGGYGEDIYWENDVLTMSGITLNPSYLFAASLALRGTWADITCCDETLPDYVKTAATDAVANSDNLWTASNAKLTNTIVQVVTNYIDHTNVRFSNEVMAVGLAIPTNIVDAINYMATNDTLVAALGEFADNPPIDPTTGATTVGGLLAALAAAVAWLKRETLKKGLSAQGVPSDSNVASLFTGSNTSLVAVCREYGGTQIKQDENGNFYYEVEVED